MFTYSIQTTTLIDLRNQDTGSCITVSLHHKLATDVASTGPANHTFLTNNGIGCLKIKTTDLIMRPSP